MIMRCFVRFVMFLIYVDILFVLLVFMVPAEMVSDGRVDVSLEDIFHAFLIF